MAFMDKLGQMANKVGEVAGDTFDYGKAKGKVVLEKGKIKDVKEAMGDYVYDAVSSSGEIDMDRIKAVANIEDLQAEARQSGDNLSETFGGREEE